MFSASCLISSTTRQTHSLFAIREEPTTQIWQISIPHVQAGGWGVICPYVDAILPGFLNGRPEQFPMIIQQRSFIFMSRAPVDR